MLIKFNKYCMENIDEKYITNRFCSFYTNCIPIYGKQLNYAITGIRNDNELLKIKSRMRKSGIKFKYFKKQKNYKNGSIMLYFYYEPILTISKNNFDKNLYDFDKNIIKNQYNFNKFYIK